MVRAILFLTAALLHSASGAAWGGLPRNAVSSVDEASQLADEARLEIRQASCPRPTTTVTTTKTSTRSTTVTIPTYTTSTVSTTKTIQTTSTQTATTTKTLSTTTTYKVTSTITATTTKATTTTLRTTITQTAMVSKTTTFTTTSTTTTTKESTITKTATSCPTTTCPVCPPASTSATTAVTTTTGTVTTTAGSSTGTTGSTAPASCTKVGDVVTNSLSGMFSNFYSGNGASIPRPVYDTDYANHPPQATWYSPEVSICDALMDCTRITQTSGYNTVQLLRDASSGRWTCLMSWAPLQDPNVFEPDAAITEVYGFYFTSSLTSTTAITTATVVSTTSTASASSSSLPLCNPVKDGSFENARQDQLDGDPSWDPATDTFSTAPYAVGDWWTQSDSNTGTGSGVSANGPSWAQSGLQEAVFVATSSVTISTWQDLPNLNGIYSLTYYYSVLDVWRGSPCTFQVKIGDNVIDSFQVTASMASPGRDQLPYTPRTVAKTPFLSGTLRLSFNYICTDPLTSTVSFFDSVSMALEGSDPGVNCALASENGGSAAGTSSGVVSPTATTPTTLATATSTTKCDVLTDGSFEDVPINQFFVQGATAGGWTVGGETLFESNVNNAYQTSYGTNFAVLYGWRSAFAGPATLSQDLSGLSGQYTLAYSYQIPYYDTRFAPAGQPCQMTATFAGATIDAIPAIEQAQFDWVNRTSTFTPAASSGRLTIAVTCPADMDMDLVMDNFSLTKVGCP